MQENLVEKQKNIQSTIFEGFIDEENQEIRINNQEEMELS